MKQTRGAIGNLINRYRAVLKKCHLLNTFGSLALAGMLVLGRATVSMAADVTINTIDQTVTGQIYDGKHDGTLTFAGPESFHFEAVAIGFDTIQVNEGVTVEVANLCTGYVGNGTENTTGGGIWGNSQGPNPATFTVTGEGTLISEHISVDATKTLIIEGNVKLQNISYGPITELKVDPEGMLIIKDGGVLDVSMQTAFVTNEDNFKVEAGGTLIVASGLDVKGEIAGTLQVKGDISLSDLSGGTVYAEEDITLDMSLDNSQGTLKADRNIDAAGQEGSVRSFV